MIKKIIFFLGIGIMINSGCKGNYKTQEDYKTLINNNIDGYFFLRETIYLKDSTNKINDIKNSLKVFSIKTGEVIYYDLALVLGLRQVFDANAGVNKGEAISRMYFTPDRKFMAFRIFGVDEAGNEYSNRSNKFKTIQLDLQTGQIQTVLFPEYCEPVSMPDEKTWLYIDYSLEKSKGKITYKIFDTDFGVSRAIYTINDITKSKTVPHNFSAFYDLQNKVLAFINYYLNDDYIYFYFEETDETERSEYKPYWQIQMHNHNLIIGLKDREWYTYDLKNRQYEKIPFNASVIYPVSNNIFFFKDFMKPVFNRIGLDSSNYFRLGLYDIEKEEVVARWFDNSTSYDPYVPEYLPVINISEEYRIKYP
jgi:hypothetical protein